MSNKKKLFTDFHEIEPFEGNLFLKSKSSIIENKKMLRKFITKMSYNEVVKKLNNIKSADELQKQILYPSLLSILKKYGRKITLYGFKNISPNKRYLFISNHRDIIMDPFVLCIKLIELGMNTPKICLGDNLLKNNFVKKIIKLNKGVTVKRSIYGKELLKSSMLLSSYIHREITQGTDSVWIAQKEGRAKDGNDKTNPGLIKMLLFSNNSSIKEHIKSFNIVPISISYEYDPLDVFKACEINSKTENTKKTNSSDYKSMLLGVFKDKGDINISIGKCLNDYIDTLNNINNKNEFCNKIASKIDAIIQENFKNFPSNYIAYDEINNTNISNNYIKNNKTSKKDEFMAHINRQLKIITNDDKKKQELKEIMLKSYSKSVENLIKLS